MKQRGNLQDAINAHSINATRFSEQEMMQLFRGTCEAVRAMHDFRGPLASSSSQPSSQNHKSTYQAREQGDHHSDDEDESFPHPEGDGEGGYSYHGNDAASSIPLVTKRRGEQQGDVVYDGDEELADHGLENGDVDPRKTELVPYAHRDLKPG